MHTHNHPHHHDISLMSEHRLALAILANVLLTFFQVLGGIISGSLSLIADAMHNFSDAASLVTAWVAVRIGRKPADKMNTYGYKRAETIAALINFTALIMIGIYLMTEAVKRFYDPEPVAGMIMIGVAGFALIVDVITAWLTYSLSKNSMNMRAAFIHNLSDALASIGVIIGGILILTLGWVWIDAAITLVIAGYVLWHGFHEIPKAIHLLMDSTPEDIDLEELIKAVEQIPTVKNIHHIHIRRMNEYINAMEAHVIIEDMLVLSQTKSQIKKLIKDKFNIVHSTLEFEVKNQDRFKRQR